MRITHVNVGWFFWGVLFLVLVGSPRNGRASEINHCHQALDKEMEQTSLSRLIEDLVRLRLSGLRALDSSQPSGQEPSSLAGPPAQTLQIHHSLFKEKIFELQKVYSEEKLKWILDTVRVETASRLKAGVQRAETSSVSIENQDRRESKPFSLWKPSVVRHIFQPRGKVLEVLLSPHQKNLLTVTEKTAFLWRVADGVLMAKLESSKAPIEGAQFSPAGDLIVTSHPHKALKIWDGETGKFRQNLKLSLKAKLFTRLYSFGGTKEKTPLVFSPDGKLLITGGHKETLQVWRVQDFKFLGHIPLGSGVEATSLAISPTSKTLAVGYVKDYGVSWLKYGTIKFFDLDSRTLIKDLDDRDDFQKEYSAISRLNFSTDGTALFGEFKSKTPFWMASQDGPLLNLYEILGTQFEDVVDSARLSLDGKFWVLVAKTGIGAIFKRENTDGERRYVIVSEFSMDNPELGKLRKAFLSADNRWLISISKLPKRGAQPPEGLEEVVTLWKLIHDIDANGDFI